METNERSLMTELSEIQTCKALDGLRNWYGDFHTTFAAKIENGKYPTDKYTIYVITTNGKVSGAKANQMAAFIQGICYTLGN